MDAESGIEPVEVDATSTRIISGVDRIEHCRGGTALWQDRVDLACVRILESIVAAEGIGVEAIEHVARAASPRHEFESEHITAAAAINPHFAAIVGRDSDVLACKPQ